MERERGGGGGRKRVDERGRGGEGNRRYESERDTDKRRGDIYRQVLVHKNPSVGSEIVRRAGDPQLLWTGEGRGAGERRHRREIFTDIQRYRHVLLYTQNTNRSGRTQVSGGAREWASPSTAFDGVVVLLDAGGADADAGVLKEKLRVDVAQHLAVALSLDDLRFISRQMCTQNKTHREAQPSPSRNVSGEGHVWCGRCIAMGEK